MNIYEWSWIICGLLAYGMLIRNWKQNKDMYWNAGTIAGCILWGPFSLVAFLFVAWLAKYHPGKIRIEFTPKEK